MKYFLAAICLLTSACVQFPACFKHPCVPIPGESRAAPNQQTLAAAGMLETARYYVPKCKDFKVLNTEYLGEDKYNWWDEKWTIEACGRKFSNNISFHKIYGTVGSKPGAMKEIK